MAKWSTAHRRAFRPAIKGSRRARAGANRPRRFFTFGLAVVFGALLVATLLPQPAASATAPRLIASVADVLNLATYKVRTTLARPGGAETVRTTNGLLLVPTLVDVHGPGGGLGAALPDMTVTVLPTLTSVHLLINALPLSPVLPVQVEVTFDLPGGRGASFGFDQRTSVAPRRLDTSLAFSIFDPPKGEFDFTVKPTGAPASLTLIGELFTRGTGGTRIDPKSGRLTVTPVPTQTEFGLAIAAETPRATSGDPLAPIARKTVTVDVVPSSSTKAHAIATDVSGPDRLVVDATLDQLPKATTVTYIDETQSATPTETETLRRVKYSAAAAIGHIDTLVTQSVAGVVTRTIDADVTDLPASFTADVRQHTQLDAGVPVLERTNVDWLAGAPIGAVDVVISDLDAAGLPTRQVVANVDDVPEELHVVHETSGVDDPATPADERRTVVDARAPGNPIGSIQLGLAKGGPVVLPDARALFGPGELAAGDVPAYVVADGDDAALGMTNLTSARLDTADPTRALEPLVVDVTAGAGPFVARALAYDETSGALTRDLVARVLDRPAHSVVAYAEPPVAAGAPRFRHIDYSGNAAVDKVVATIKTELDTPTPTVIGATATGIPERFGIDLTTDETVVDGRNVSTTDVGYSAPTAVDAVDLTVDAVAADGQTLHAEGHLRDLPLAFDLVAAQRAESSPGALDSSTRAEFTVTDGPALGSLSGGFVRGSVVVPFIDPVPLFDALDEDERPPAGEQPGYVSIDDDDIALGITGVTHALLDTADPTDPAQQEPPIVVDVTATPGSFAAQALTYNDAGALTTEVVALIPDRPQQSRIDLATPPAAAALEDPEASRKVIGYAGNDEVPAVFATIRTGLDTDEQTTIDAKVTDIPTSFTVDVESADLLDDEQEISTVDVMYRAEDSVNAIDVDVEVVAADGVVVQRAEAHLTDLPTAFTLAAELRGESPSGEKASARIDFLVTEGAPLGSIRAGASTGPAAVQFLNSRTFFDPEELARGEVPAYAFLYDEAEADGGEKGAAVELRDVRAAVVDTANPTLVHLEADPQKLLVHQLDGSRRVEATIFDIPSVVDLSIFTPDDGGLSAEYTGSTPIDRIEAFVSDSVVPLVPGSADGVQGISSIDLIIDEVPTTLEVTSSGDEVDEANRAVAIKPPSACGDPRFQINPLICDGLLAGGPGGGIIGALPTGCDEGGSVNPALCELLAVPDGIVVKTGAGGGRIDEVQALLTSQLRDGPVDDAAIASQVDFGMGELSDVLATNEDGALLDVSAEGRQTMYTRVRDLTLMHIDAGSEDFDIDGPIDSDSFADADLPQQKQLEDVQTVAAVDRLSTVSIDVERDVQAGGPTTLAVRTENGVSAGPGETDYLMMSLLNAPDNVEFTSSNHAKRELESVGFDEPCLRERTPDGSRSIYCEDAMAIYYEASAASGRFSVNTNAGDRENLFVDVPSLPAEVDFCVATDGDCTGYAKAVPVTGLSVRFAASARVTGLDVVDCLENAPQVIVFGGGCGLNGTGVFDNVTTPPLSLPAFRYLAVSDLRVRFLEIEANVPPVPGEPMGHLFLNTTKRRAGDPVGTHQVDGRIEIRSQSDDTVCEAKDSLARFVLKGVKADQRYATLHVANADFEDRPCFVALGGVVIDNRNDEEGQGTMTDDGLSSFDVAAGGIGGELRTELLRAG